MIAAGTCALNPRQNLLAAVPTATHKNKRSTYRRRRNLLTFGNENLRDKTCPRNSDMRQGVLCQYGEACQRESYLESGSQSFWHSKSTVALSVSISQKTSPALTSSPSFTLHDAIVPAVMVGDKDGSPTTVWSGSAWATRSAGVGSERCARSLTIKKERLRTAAEVPSKDAAYAGTARRSIRRQPATGTQSWRQWLWVQQGCGEKRMSFRGTFLGLSVADVRACSLCESSGKAHGQLGTNLKTAACRTP